MLYWHSQRTLFCHIAAAQGGISVCAVHVCVWKVASHMRPVPSELPPGFSSSPPVSGQFSGQRPVPTGSIGASWLWGTVRGVITGVIAALLCVVSVIFSAVLGLSGPTSIMLICWGAALMGAL